MSNVHSGSCLCGAVHFTVRDMDRDVICCHCSQCRKQTGLYYASTRCADDQLDVSGGENVTWYQSSEKGRRGFCAKCGSALFWKYGDTDEIMIQAGSFDQPSNLKFAFHIFCADKADFYEINDGLPQYAKSMPGLETNSD